MKTWEKKYPEKKTERVAKFVVYQNRILNLPNSAYKSNNDKNQKLKLRFEITLLKFTTAPVQYWNHFLFHLTSVERRVKLKNTRKKEQDNTRHFSRVVSQARIRRTNQKIGRTRWQQDWESRQANGLVSLYFRFYLSTERNNKNFAGWTFLNW